MSWKIGVEKSLVTLANFALFFCNPGWACYKISAYDWIFLSVCLEKNVRRKQVLKSEYLKIVYFIVRPNAILRYLAVLYHLNQDIKDARNREKNRSLYFMVLLCS